MDENAMKNIVVLKNIQSNIVEEAFVILKSNVKIHKLQKIDKTKNDLREEKVKTKDYMIKEAESVVNEYIAQIQKKEYNKSDGNKKIKEKYKRLKAITIFLFIFSVLSSICILLKQ